MAGGFRRCRVACDGSTSGNPHSDCPAVPLAESLPVTDFKWLQRLRRAAAAAIHIPTCQMQNRCKTPLLAGVLQRFEAALRPQRRAATEG